MWWYKDARIGRLWIHGGINKGFALGFSIDRYHLMLDFGILWIGIEW